MELNEKIKKGLECCLVSDENFCDCEGCPYATGGHQTADCDVELGKHTIDIIAQLEKKNATLLNTLSCVMHFIDKWLENATPYDPDADPDGDIAVNRAAEARKIALRAIEEAEWRNIQWNATATHNPTKWRKDDKEKTLVNYLLFSPDYGVDIGNYLEPAGIWLIMGLPVKNVTHWAELPQPPKEEHR